MPNKLNIDLMHEVVIISQEYLNGDQYDDPINRLFFVTGGFGSKAKTPNMLGFALFGKFVISGREARQEGYHVERLATVEEHIEAVAKAGGLLI